jgi:hypothetical protein
MNAMNYDFTTGTTFAAENSSESSTKRELTPFQKGVVTVAAIGVAGAAVGAGLYWVNRGLRETADNIGDAADGIRAAHARHEQKKTAKAIANAAIAEAINQG